MLEFKDVELSDKGVLEKYLKGNPYDNCDYSFTNIYMWRKKYKTRFALSGGLLILFSGDAVFLMPVGDGDLKKGLEEMIFYAKEKGIAFKMGAITPQMRERIEKVMPDMFDFFEDRDNSDYIYLSEKLIGLAGKKLHSKRNHINKFKGMYAYSFEEITTDNIEEVVGMHSKWCLLNACTDDADLLEESCAVRDVLRNFKTIGLVGGLLKVDGRVVAFSMGQPLNEKTFDVCIEKAFYDVNGAYTMINQLFAEQFCKEYLYMNREEDLGVEGLRKAKLSYYPEVILDKGMAVLR